ncbi:hypothetical protein O9G_002132 [Rozella allomycis CSF55]|uniref:Uncharacterized protein n=1 Tax=Rozella allomycis (strain CSF55) TaxID=988480 RepID=A0A075AU92_ROZAC|nr:hypothetical protein O9G_002132 [Rozella allomycis CSF55]|eukprot:EPZ32292.1 hypothetical protein O9G_002132 [Rozella allomycis CSF55]
MAFSLLTSKRFEIDRFAMLSPSPLEYKPEMVISPSPGAYVMKLHSITPKIAFHGTPGPRNVFPLNKAQLDYPAPNIYNVPSEMSNVRSSIERRQRAKAIIEKDLGDIQRMLIDAQVNEDKEAIKTLPRIYFPHRN